MERFETWSQLMLLFFQGLVNVDARTSRIANKPDDLDVVVHCTGTESKLHACRTVVLFYVFHVCVVCMPESCSGLWDCHLFLVATTSNLHSTYCAQCRPLLIEERERESPSKLGDVLPRAVSQPLP